MGGSVTRILPLIKHFLAELCACAQKVFCQSTARKAFIHAASMVKRACGSGELKNIALHCD
jgi:hypothetical protein